MILKILRILGMMRIGWFYKAQRIRQSISRKRILRSVKKNLINGMRNSTNGITILGQRKKNSRRGEKNSKRSIGKKMENLIRKTSRSGTKNSMTGKRILMTGKRI